MYAKALSVEDLNNPATSNTTISEPTWEDIEAAIRQLNGDRRSTVIIGPDDSGNEYMGIGGGRDGVYVCSLYRGDQFNLVNPADLSEELVMVVNGQRLTYPRRQCVPLSLVLEAARQYAASGRKHAELLWDEV